MPNPFFVLARLGPAVALFVALVGAHPPTAHAAAPAGPYRWAEADGTLHLSERLTDVAEPYRSIYRAAQVVGASGAQAGGRVASGLEGERAAWQARLATARLNLVAATRAYADVVDGNRAKSQANNPILALISQDPEATAQADASAAAARTKFLTAYKALTIDLPRSAQAARVPMAWLQ